MSYQPLRTCTHVRVQIRDVGLHVYRWQGADRPIVFLHGWGDSGETYQFLIDHLRLGHECVAPDMRGFGRSSWAHEGYWFPDYLADLDALLEQLAPDTAVDIVGHSMGGNIAMLYAGIRPERVRRLVSLEGFGLPRTQPEQAPLRYRKWLDQVRAGPQAYAKYESFERFEDALRQRNPRITAERIAFIARAWAEQTAPGHVVPRADPRHKWINAVLYRREEAESCWRNMTAAVLLIRGAQSELAYCMEDAPEFVQAVASLRDVRVATIAGAGHMIHHEQPEEAARLIEQFLTD